MKQMSWKTLLLVFIVTVIGTFVGIPIRNCLQEWQTQKQEEKKEEKKEEDEDYQTCHIEAIDPVTIDGLDGSYMVVKAVHQRKNASGDWVDTNIEIINAEKFMVDDEKYLFEELSIDKRCYNWKSLELIDTVSEEDCNNRRTVYYGLRNTENTAIKQADDATMIYFDETIEHLKASDKFMTILFYFFFAILLLMIIMGIGIMIFL